MDLELDLKNQRGRFRAAGYERPALLALAMVLVFILALVIGTDLINLLHVSDCGMPGR